MSGLRGMVLGEIRGQGRWRSESFMHQLSLNGSLLLHPNHDRIWSESFWQQNMRPRRGWVTERQVLLSLPAGQVRRELWQASFRWCSAILAFRRELGEYLALRGLAGDPLEQDLDAQILRVSAQLEELSWCLEDDDQGQIEIVYL